MPLSVTRACARLVAVLAAVTTMLVATPAFAAEGSIDHIEPRGGKLEVLYSLPGVGEATPDLSTLQFSLDGQPLDAKATLASDAKQGVRRTAILAIDVSNSMRAGGRFEAAKRAAKLFLDTAPDDLYVGIVTFAGSVTVAQEPTRDRTAAAAVIDGLQMSFGTVLYDALRQAVSLSGKAGQRSIIVLSDGKDGNSTIGADVLTAAVKGSGVKMDVVALGQASEQDESLGALASAGNGSVISAADADALGQAFADEAQTLAKQIQITSVLPADAGREGTLAVSVDAGGQSYTDAAFVTLPARAKEPAEPGPSTTLTAPAPGMSLTPQVMVAGLLALGAGLLVLLTILFGGLGRKPESLEATIAPYTRKGAGKRVSDAAQQGVAAQAVGIATKALESNRGLEVKLGNKLEAGGLALKPAEWLLIHAGIAVGATAMAFLLTGGDPLFTVITFVVGVLLPWVYLGRKQASRLKAFNGQLAGTLQLMAGSLQAGLSLAQGMDTIVREGAEPMAGEFRRALVETRLGVPIEDALESIGGRMMSDDFTWTVMAIRIQREVGGNLAELMLNVAATLRERDYLRRQVKSLSAEGRFSAYILLALPPLILLYEMMTNRNYVQPLYTTPVGWVMLAGMGLLMGVGGFMMSRMVKLEV